MRMISLSQLQKIDPQLQALSNTDLKEVRLQLYTLAELALDVWKKHQSITGDQTKNPLDRFDSQVNPSTL
jgi:hypothetical protein